MVNRIAQLESNLARQGRPQRRQPSVPLKRPRSHRMKPPAVQALQRSISYTVPGPVPTLAQAKTMGCWATALTILISWRDRMSRTVESVMGEIGDTWLKLYQDNTGLFPRQEQRLFRAAGLEARRGVNLSAEGWLDILKGSGPIWVTTDEAPGKPGGMHARIVKGIHGDGTAEGTRLDIIDPNGGREYSETIAQFLPKYEAEVAESGRLRFQIIYLAEGARVAQQKGLRHRALSTVPRRRARSLVLPVDYAAPEPVPVLAQPSGMTCWATVFTILYSWKRGQSIPTEAALADIGQRWVDKFNNNEGIGAKEKVDFVAEAGLVAEPPQSLSIEGWEQMLRDYGPIWVTTDEAAGKPWAIHARIITAIRGDGTPRGTKFAIIDPAGGRKYEESVAVFVPKYEEEVIKTGYTRIQILHWPKDARFGTAKSYQAVRSLGQYSAAKQLALQHITHAGPYRLAYDRLTTLGVIEPLPGRNTRRFRGTAALQTALNNWAPYIREVMEPPGYILTGGLYVNKPGEHGNGNAVDVDGFWWSSTNKFLANDAPTDWVRYLTIEATLRKVFGTVLNYDYNAAHHDHWHCDLGASTNWRSVKSQAKFAQRALKEIWGENLAVDGKWGNLSRTAASRSGYDFSAAGGWDHFLDNIRNRESTPAVAQDNGAAVGLAVSATSGPANLEAAKQDLLAKGISLQQIEAILATLNIPAQTQSLARVRAFERGMELDVPRAEPLAAAERWLLLGALATTPIGPLVPGIQLLANKFNVTIGVGPAGTAGFLGGAGGGFGVVFAPGNRIGYYGSVSGVVGAIASISANMQVTVVKGGPENFGGRAVLSGITVDLAEGPTLGAHVISVDGKPVGVTGEVGLTLGLSPIEAFITVQDTNTSLEPSAQGAPSPLKAAQSRAPQTETSDLRGIAKQAAVTVNEQLKDQISAGKIIFDAGKEAELKNQLLQENSGVKVTQTLQSLVLKLSQLVAPHIRISSLVRTSGHHGAGRAVDIGNEEIADSLLPLVASDEQVEALEIDELIFDASVAGEADRNEWNYDQGSKHAYNNATLNDHKDHIHLSVKA